MYSKSSYFDHELVEMALFAQRLPVILVRIQVAISGYIFDILSGVKL
jgi:hypothetical protein